jgi:hypothetical protein
VLDLTIRQAYFCYFYQLEPQPLSKSWAKRIPAFLRKLELVAGFGNPAFKESGHNGMPSFSNSNDAVDQYHQTPLS